MRNGCILRGDVGTGKSITAMAYYFLKVAKGKINTDGSTLGLEPMQNPTDLYVITTAKKRNDKDWEGEAAPFVVGPERAASISGVQLTVDSWNNIIRYVDVKNAFFIFDEQRLVGSGSWVKAFLKIAKSNQWVLLSATPGDVWMDYVPVFIANGFYDNKTQFIRRHVVMKSFTKFPQIDRYIATTTLKHYRALIEVDMPYERHTKRHIHPVHVDYNKEMFQKVTKDRWNVYEERPIKESAELFSVMRRVTNSDLSRLGETMKVLEKHPRLIIFYNFDYELNMLRTLANTVGTPVSEWNGHKHQPIPDGDRWVYLVQYTAGAEGWNCVSTDATLFYSLNYSYKINEQSKGRIDRLNTEYVDLHYYILQSQSLIDKAILQSLKTKQSFNEKKFIAKLLNH